MQKPSAPISYANCLYLAIGLCLFACTSEIADPLETSHSSNEYQSSFFENQSSSNDSMIAFNSSSSSDEGFLTNSSSSFSPKQVVHIYPKTEGPDQNPLKGWNSGWWVDMEIASVGFQYIPWKKFEPVDDQFDFDAIEEIIARPGSKGRHLILRLYCDWAGENPASDGPPWLYSNLNIARMQDSTGRYLTDFNDPNYIAEALEAIQTLAQHYDKDPRAYAFEMGVLGYWGEWHTFLFKGDFSLSETTKTAIVKSYQENFSNAQIMGRYPWAEPLESATKIGYHNDFFGPFEHSDQFDESILTQRKWLEGPIGGETPPSITSEQLTEMYNSPKGIEIIAKGHYSTMKPQGAPCTETPESLTCLGFLKMHRLMGYNYQIDSVFFADSIETTSQLEVFIHGTNIGVAPFYMDWEIQIALLDSLENPIALKTTQYDLRKIKDKDSFLFIDSFETSGLQLGSYTLALRILQPEADQPKPNPWGLEARNTYILFSNEIKTIEGKWSAENTLIGGWSILGTVLIN